MEEIMNDRAKFVEVNDEQQKRINEVRKLFSEIYTLVYTKLEEAQFWAIKGVTREQ